jgi:hypothetical protein
MQERSSSRVTLTDLSTLHTGDGGLSRPEVPAGLSCRTLSSVGAGGDKVRLFGAGDAIDRAVRAVAVIDWSEASPAAR